MSSFLTFALLVRPFVLRLQGVQDVTPQTLAVRADFTWPKADKRREFLRVRHKLGGRTGPVQQPEFGCAHFGRLG